MTLTNIEISMPLYPSSANRSPEDATEEYADV